MEFYTEGLSANEESCYWQGFSQGKLIRDVLGGIGALKALAVREGGDMLLNYFTKFDSAGVSVDEE